MRGWRKKQKWQVIAALLFAVWILMGTRKINVNAENMEACLLYTSDAADE